MSVRSGAVTIKEIESVVSVMKSLENMDGSVNSVSINISPSLKVDFTRSGGEWGAVFVVDDYSNNGYFR